MLSYVISMIFGVAVFCAGMMFERKSPEKRRSTRRTEENPGGERGFLRQWENLLNYDGNAQEGEYEDR